MFTGIVKATGRVECVTRTGGDLRLRISAPDLAWSDFASGESVAVNGVCLTAAKIFGNGFEADVSAESTAVTTLGNLAKGSRVNLEPPIGLGKRLGGHLVSGHVDCVGRIVAREADGRSVRLVVEIPAEYSRYMVRKGSVCMDGVSLTVNEVTACTFGVNIIPHTVENTIIGDYRTGTEVNIEVDILARYVERLLHEGKDSAITEDFLRAHGYA